MDAQLDGEHNTGPRRGEFSSLEKLPYAMPCVWKNFEMKNTLLAKVNN